MARRWWQRPHALYAIPSRRTIGLRVYVCAALGFAATEAVARWLLKDRGIDMTVLLALAALLIAHVVDQVFQRRVLRRHSHAWYCRTYPAHVRKDGRVGCRHCGDRRIHRQVVSHNKDVRARVCLGCHATLFYGED